MDDRRKFPRIDLSLQVKYYSPSDEARFGHTITTNISRGGLSMPAVSGIVRKGDVIKMDIRRNDREGAIPATGRVKWTVIRKRKAILDEDAGIEFININPYGIDRLLKAA